MFNKDLKNKMFTVDHILTNHEASITDLMIQVTSLKNRLSALEINHTESKKPLSNYKISFTFTDQDGSPNSGFCNDPQYISEVFDFVRNLKGSNLVIRDDTVYPG